MITQRWDNKKQYEGNESEYSALDVTHHSTTRERGAMTLVFASTFSSLKWWVVPRPASPCCRPCKQHVLKLSWLKNGKSGRNITFKWVISVNAGGWPMLVLISWDWAEWDLPRVVFHWFNQCWAEETQCIVTWDEMWLCVRLFLYDLHWYRSLLFMVFDKVSKELYSANIVLAFQQMQYIYFAL